MHIRLMKPNPVSSVEIKEKLALGYQDKIISWGKLNYREFPWRANRTPYSVLVCEILLRRTTAQAVANIYELFSLVKIYLFDQKNQGR